MSTANDSTDDDGTQGVDEQQHQEAETFVNGLLASAAQGLGMATATTTAPRAQQQVQPSSNQTWIQNMAALLANASPEMRQATANMLATQGASTGGPAPGAAMQQTAQGRAPSAPGTPQAIPGAAVTPQTRGRVRLLVPGEMVATMQGQATNGTPIGTTTNANATQGGEMSTLLCHNNK